MKPMIHFDAQGKGRYKSGEMAECGKTKRRITASVHAVTCGTCRKTDVFKAALIEAKTVIKPVALNNCDIEPATWESGSKVRLSSQGKRDGIKSNEWVAMSIKEVFGKALTNEATIKRVSSTNVVYFEENNGAFGMFKSRLELVDGLFSG